MADGTTDAGAGQSEQTQPNGHTTPPQQTLKNYITADLSATGLFFLRMTTIGCSIVYFISTLGILGLVHAAYLNAMLSAFFTFSIRFFQRYKQANIHPFSKEMLNLLASEDSGHYMLYTFFYYNQHPLTIYLIPPFLYALMFSVNYSNGLLPFLPAGLRRVWGQLNDKIAGGQLEIRRFIAYTEIFLMAVVIWNAFIGYMFILAPFMHYQILKLRYQSLRNNSVALVFSDLRVACDTLARHPRCPPFISTIITKMVSFVSALAPQRPMRREA